MSKLDLSLEIQLDRVNHILNLLILVLGQDGHVVICEVNDILKIGALTIDAQEELLVAGQSDGLVVVAAL